MSKLELIKEANRILDKLESQIKKIGEVSSSSETTGMDIRPAI